MKGRLWKRALSLLLAVMMAVTVLPLQAFASIQELLGNSAQENQAILDELASITGSEEDAQRYYQLLRQYNLLDEDGHTVEDWSVTMDGEEISIAEIRQVLEGDYDPQQYVWVDGTPVTLENLDLMLQIEDYISYLSETYFSQQEWDEEQLASLESLQKQVQESGIQILAANDGEPIIGSGGVSHSARVTVTPTPAVEGSTATFAVHLGGAAEGQEVSFTWSAYGVNGLASGSGTVNLTAAADGTATESFTVSLDEGISDTVFTTGGMKYYVNFSGITNALFSTNDSTGGAAEAMTLACGAVEGGNLPEGYLDKLMPGGTFRPTFPVNTAENGSNGFHSEGVTNQDEAYTENDIQPVAVPLDDFSKYVIQQGLADTLQAQSTSYPATNENGMYFYDQVPQAVGGDNDRVAWTKGNALELALSPMPDVIHSVEGVTDPFDNVWELTYTNVPGLGYGPGGSQELPAAQRNYAGAALYEPTFYLNGQYLGSQRFGAQGAKDMVLQENPYFADSSVYRVGPVFEGEGTLATFDMPLSDNTKERLLAGEPLSITTPVYGVAVAYENEYHYEEKFATGDRTLEIGGQTFRYRFWNGGYARLYMSDTANDAIDGTGDPWLVHRTIEKMENLDLTTVQCTIGSSTTNVSLVNTNAPVVESVSAPEGAYYPGQIVPVTVTFDEPVDLSTVEVVVNTETLKADSTGYSNVATVAYTVPANYGTTVNVSSITASDTAGNALTGYNPGGEDQAGKELEGVTLKSLPSTAVENVTAELDGNLAKPQVTLSVQLVEDAKAVEWLNSHWNSDNTFDIKAIALRQVGAENEQELIALSLAREEGEGTSALAGKALTATVELPPNGSSDPLTTTFELVVNGQTVLGKVATVTQAGFTPIEEGEWNGVIDINVSEDSEAPYDFEEYGDPVIYMQDDPYIEIYGYTEDDEYIYPYGGSEGSIATTFKMNAQGTAYLTDEDGKMIPESEEADFGVYLTDPKVARLELTEDSREVKLIPLTIGKTGVKVVALNAGLADWVEVDASYSITDIYNRDTILRFDGGLTPLLTMPEKMSVPAYQNATIYWSSNLHDKDENVQYQITVSEAGSSSPVYSTTAPSEENPLPSRCTIPAEELKPGNTYDVKVSGRYNTESDDTASLEATTELTVEEPNVTVTLEALDSYYITDEVGPQTFSWRVTSPDSDTSLIPVTFTVTRDDGTPLTPTINGNSATVTIPGVELNEADPNSYRDVYTVTAQVTNGAEGDAATSVSYDSFLLYVYSKEALDILVGGEAKDELTLSNRTLAKEWNKTWQDEVLELDRDIHLKDVISVNYGMYAWNEVSDQIRWESSDSSVASIDYKQGAVYENIENFKNNVTYRPTSDFLLAGHKDGDTTITATHNLLEELSTSVNVHVETLKDKLYLFQCYPQGETTLSFEVYTDSSHNTTEEVKITSDVNGAAAYYAEFGIASNVTCSAEVDGNQYYGTFYQSSLESGEPDAARMGLYPCNNMELRRAAYADLYIKKPDGTPYTGEITFRGGVYVNDAYQEDTRFRLNTIDGIGQENNKENGITVDLNNTNGRLEIAMDITQWSSGENPIAAGDQISYVFQIEKAIIPCW